MEPITREDWAGFTEDWLEIQPASRLTVLVERVLRATDLEEIPEEGTSAYYKEFLPAFNDVALSMALDDLLHEMTGEGLLTTDGVDAEGQIMYVVTEDGHEFCEQDSEPEAEPSYE